MLWIQVFGVPVCLAGEDCVAFAVNNSFSMFFYALFCFAAIGVINNKCKLIKYIKVALDRL